VETTAICFPKDRSSLILPVSPPVTAGFQGVEKLLLFMLLLSFLVLCIDTVARNAVCPVEECVVYWYSIE
jgi:hypothetical protein